MKITFLGHATVLVEMNSKKILFDPFITGNSLTQHIDISYLVVYYLFVTHGHEDHVLDVEAIMKNNPDALLVSNFEIVSWFGKKISLAMRWITGEKHEFDFGTVKYVNAVHSSVLPDGNYEGNPGGFIVYDDSKSLYIAGDTALTKDMELIPLLCPKLDVALLPVGDNFTMGYEDTLIASDLIRCDTIIGYHFDTFPPIEIDKPKAVKYFKDKDKDKGKELVLLNVGESLSI